MQVILRVNKCAVDIILELTNMINTMEIIGVM